MIVNNGNKKVGDIVGFIVNIIVKIVDFELIRFIGLWKNFSGVNIVNMIDKINGDCGIKFLKIVEK